MRLFCFALVVGLSTLGCDDRAPTNGGDDAGARDAGRPAGARAIASWRMRCAESCPDEPAPDRVIDRVNREGGYEIACDVSSTGAERRFDLTARLGESHGFQVTGARVETSGVRITSSFCRVRFWEEEDATVVGNCSNNPPTPDVPCQFQRIRIRDVDGVPTVSGELRCIGIELDGTPGINRDITAPEAASSFALFSFTGCAGL